MVISYNRAALVGTCLRALGFADEVIVVDKSSTDATPQIAARYADRVITVPWSPVADDTRDFALDQCSGDWVLWLDDDECLAPQAGSAIRTELAAPRADVYYLPLRHYILGVHDEAAYYWPEHHPRLFRRGALAFKSTVHDTAEVVSNHTLHLSPDSGIVIHHLSHRDVAEWIDKCNRYTSRADRRRPEHAGHGIAAFAHARLDYWQSRSQGSDPGGYPAAVAVLRAVYDMVDRLKTWEEERGLDGAAAFTAICRELDAAHAEAAPAPPRAGVMSHATPPAPAAPDDAARAALVARVDELRSRCDALAADVARWAGEAARLDTACQAAAERDRQHREDADRMAETMRHRADAAEQAAATAREQMETARQDAALRLRAAEALQEAATAALQRLAAIEASTSWRATAGIRRIGAEIKRLLRQPGPRGAGFPAVGSRHSPGQESS